MDSIKRAHAAINNADARFREIDRELRHGKHPVESAMIAAEAVLGDKVALGDKEVKGTDCPTCNVQKITDVQQRAFTVRRTVGELAELERHLQDGGRQDGVLCDCIQKHLAQIETLASEMVNFGGGEEWRGLKEWAVNRYPTFHADKVAGLQPGDRVFVQAMEEARAMRKRIS